MLCQHRGIDTRQRGMIDAQGMAGVGGEEPGAEHLNAGNRKPLRTCEGKAGFAVVVTPGIAGSGVEQDAHRGEVDGDARAFESVCVAIRAASSPQRSTPPAEKCRQRL